MTESGVLTPRPYARLLIMLSEQLIKNNIIALTELAKNSYDADADWVQIRIGNMNNFGKDGLREEEKPFVEIEDDGDGMSFENIRDSWMNPASPKKYKKRMKKKAKTKKGRIIQGEKGIGRYAVFQIGKKVEIFTREKIGEDKSGREVNLITDLTKYTDELLSEKTSSSPDAPLFFDQLLSKYYIREDPLFIKHGDIIIEGGKESRKNHGTLIRITELNYKWDEPSVKKIRSVLERLQSPFRKKDDFAVSIVYASDEVSTFESFKLEDILEEALLEMSGEVDENGMCTYILKGKRGTGEEEKGTLNLVDCLKQDKARENKLYFQDENGRITHTPTCGPFRFKFYVYDIDSMKDDRLKDYIRSHRTYIYRDDVRVYPYGDRDNDWVKLDVYRGLARAGYYLSNDQLIGYVSITSDGNPELRDKTNREGLLEQGTAYEDLRVLTLSALNFLHAEFQTLKFKPGLRAKRRKTRVSKLYLQSEKVQKRIENLDKHLKSINDLDGVKFLNKLSENYLNEKHIYERQVEIVEDLAGVGIAVDATSHDTMVVMSRALEKINEIKKLVSSKTPDMEKINDKVDTLQSQLMFIDSLLVGIQPIFRSSRRKNKELRISDIVRKVSRYYDTPIKKVAVDIEIKEIGSPLTVVSSEGVLLQLFINLMDNSIYWFEVSKTKAPKILIRIDGEKGCVVFADNGPGVEKKYVDYIFEPFFSTKGIEGRGLGLYIARQLTDRYEYDLYYVEKESEKILSGANFRIDFIEQEE
ncbi:MAG: ATP-binding protein [Thermoplasmata archaeon]